MDAIQLKRSDAMLIVDVQNDFLPGGKLAVPEGNQVIPFLNRAIALFREHALPIVATRDWHPINHCSFTQQGGIWPPHCIAGSEGAEFAATLDLPQTTMIISKAASPERDAYSGFGGTDLAERLRARHVTRLFVGGLATDYCVLNTVKDALAQDFQVVLLLDAIRAVDVNAGDGEAAVNDMLARGAMPMCVADLENAVSVHYG